MPKPATRTDPRPFTDDEVYRLLIAGKPEPLLSDFMMIAALSGMREDEIVYLTVADRADGLFQVRDGKTAASIRTLPIHSGLTTLVARRCDGTSDRDWQFHELPGAGNGRRPYVPVSKRFLRYRESLGVLEKVDGQRQSDVVTRCDAGSVRRPSTQAPLRPPPRQSSGTSARACHTAATLRVQASSN